MSEPTGRITQEQAARLMYAHAKAQKASDTYVASLWSAPHKSRSLRTDYDAAEAAFAELVATLTLKEGE